MSILELSLLGLPSLRLDGQPVHIHTVRGIPLLAYLLINPGLHSRSTLATLLYTSRERTPAFAALRTTTWRLKDAGLGPWLEIQREQLGFQEGSPAGADVLEFQRYLKEYKQHNHPDDEVCADCLPMLKTAAELYRGEFLQGLTLRDAIVFDDWQRSQADLLQYQASQVLERLVRHFRKQDDLLQAIHYARAWLAINRTNEEAHYQLMALYANAGQKQAALNQYQECVRVLKDSGQSPQPATTALYRQIFGGQRNNSSSSRSADKLASPIILCADIENSAALWGHHSQEMINLIQQVSASIKEFARHYGGRVLILTDDICLFYFESGSPLQFAIALQKNALHPIEKKLTPLKVRIAIHPANSPKPSIDSNATSIHFTKRLLTAGRGRQILLSAQALDVLELPDASRVHDYGQNTLKDLGEPIHIFELLYPGATTERRLSQQSLPTYSINLPTYPTPFIGREKELDDLGQRLAQQNCRLLTVTGPGGIGKTRLAVQSAAQQSERFPDGVVFVSLSMIQNPEQILSTLAEALHFNFYQPKDPAGQLKDYLRSRHMLLILDNFEHLVDGAALLADLLKNAPKLKILVTSRERLDLYEEWLYELSTMDIPKIGDDKLEEFSAVQLFLQNASRVYPGFAPSTSDLESIVKICQQVEGLPLGIELASGWVRTITCSEIAKRLGENIDFIENNSPDRPPRQQSLRAVFDYSWALLSEEGRRTLRKLSIFRGGFTLDAAQAVAATPLTLLTGLVDRSLLRSTPGGRFEINETLRYFAHQKLEEVPEDLASTERLHCEYYSQMFVQKIPKLISKLQMQAIDDVFMDIENLRAAKECTLAHKCWDLIGVGIKSSILFLEISGRAVEGYYDFNRMLSAARQEPEAMQAEWFPWLLMGLGWFAFQTSRHAEGLACLEESLEILKTRDDEDGKAYNLAMLSSYYSSLRYLDQAGRYLDDCLAIYNRGCLPNDSMTQAHKQFILYTASKYYLQINEITLAEQYAQAALALGEQTGSRWALARGLNVLSQIARCQEKLVEAEVLLHQAQEIAEEIGDKRGLGSIYSGLGQIYETQGLVEKGIETESLALQIGQELGDRHFSAIALNNMAYLHLLLKDPDPLKVTQYYRDSLALFQEIADQHGLLFTNYDLGQAYIKLRNPNQALICHQQALGLAQELGQASLMLYVLHGFASLAAQRGETERALELCGLLLTHPQTQDDTRQRTQSLLDELNAAANPDLAQAAFQRGQTLELEPTVTEYLG